MISALLLAAALAPAATPSPAPAVVVVRAPKAELHLEIARTPAEQERGLMYRTSLPAHGGMIFIFQGDGAIGFWMKNTLIPLDMVFVGSDGTVRQVDADVPTPPPGATDEQIPRESGFARYVIELGAGEARRDGVVPGVKLSIPALPRA